MTRHRGLTLLEILAATVMLAVMAAACVPVIASSLRSLGGPSNQTEVHQIDRLDLSQLADEFMRNPLAFGYESVDDVVVKDHVHIAWPTKDTPGARDSAKIAELPGVSVEVIHTSDPEADHVWLAFECAGQVVHRWHKLPPPGGGTEDNQP